MSRLTFSEIRRLYVGFQVEQQKQYDRQHGIRPEEREQFEEFAADVSADRGGSGVPQTAPGSAGVSPPGRIGNSRPRRHGGGPQPPRRR